MGKPKEHDCDRLYHLAFTEDKPTAAQADAVPTVHGQTVEQVLASPLFEWLIDGDHETAAVLRRASELLLAGEARSSEEESEYLMLRQDLTGRLLPEGRDPDRKVDRGSARAWDRR